MSFRICRIFQNEKPLHLILCIPPLSLYFDFSFSPILCEYWKRFCDKLKAFPFILCVCSALFKVKCQRILERHIARTIQCYSENICMYLFIQYSAIKLCSADFQNVHNPIQLSISLSDIGVTFHSHCHWHSWCVVCQSDCLFCFFPTLHSIHYHKTYQIILFILVIHLFSCVLDLNSALYFCFYFDFWIIYHRMRSRRRRKREGSSRTTTKIMKGEKKIQFQTIECQRSAL